VVLTVGGDDDALALLDLRGDALVPEGQHAVQRDLIMHEQQGIKTVSPILQAALPVRCTQLRSLRTTQPGHSKSIAHVANPRLAQETDSTRSTQGSGPYLEALRAHIGGLRDVPVLVVVARVHGRGGVDRGRGHVCSVTAAI
jgi:hypothetical protein